MKTKLLAISVALASSLTAQNQNLVANGSFEELNTCTEYRALCSPAAWFIVTATLPQPPTVKDGIRTLPFDYDNVYSPGKRDFPYTRILCPLQPGREYDLTFWLYTGIIDFPGLDVLLSKIDPARIRTGRGRLVYTFSLTPADIVQKDKGGWIQLHHRFTVDEEKNFLLLGNMQVSPSYSHRMEKKFEKSWGNIVFNLDDVRLTDADSTGGACPMYAETKEAVYAEHHRHSRYIYLDQDPQLASRPAPQAAGHNQSADTPAVAPGSYTPPTPPAPDTLTVPGVLFATNSSVLNSSYTRLLDSLIEKIGKKLPVQMEINGHTDNIGPDELNQPLSWQRARSIKTYIVGKIPSLEPLTSIHGYGSLHPVSPNDSPAHRARNRRVEIILIY